VPFAIAKGTLFFVKVRFLIFPKMTKTSQYQPSSFL
jgi:hypothetical protein